MIHFIPSGIRGTNVVIRGIHYTVLSIYSGEKNIAQKLGDIIKNDFISSNTTEITNASLSTIDIDNVEQQ